MSGHRLLVEFVMSTATLNIRVKEQRLISPADAAFYVGLDARRFKLECQVQPVQMPNGAFRFDKRDLDRWIDTLKGDVTDSDEQIVGRLS
jgi:hypothetical protein